MADNTALGAKATVARQDFSEKSIVGIDTLNGIEQPPRTLSVDGNRVVSDLVVRDYPLILHARKR